VPHSLEELLMIVLQLEGQRSLEIPLMIAAAISPRLRFRGYGKMEARC
jgi:hypothetical protein